MNLFMGALQQGILYSSLGIGIFLSFHILHTPDLTADGAFTLGGAVTAVLVLAGHPVAAIPLSFAVGAMAGVVTGLLQTKAGIMPVLAGILTMSGLYSVNLAIQGGAPNLSLLGNSTIFESIVYLEKERAKILLPLVICAFILFLMIGLLHTRWGFGIRVTGSNPALGRALGIDEKKWKVMGLGLANGLVALAGGIVTQYQGYQDINGGSGMMITGLTGVILGETLFRPKTITAKLLFSVIGTILYQILIAQAVRYNALPAYTFKLISSCLTAFALGVAYLRTRKGS